MRRVSSDAATLQRGSSGCAAAGAAVLCIGKLMIKK